ncbi:MAG: site-2 protease family protein [Candidatus Yanofskybacteria bacterium]|nr:site-2 protease family protein [Candidatus Yanofskybacteria bacterium]
MTAIIFIIVISVLVLIHEAGHFFFAKQAGMKVEEFGFGFPPRLWGFKKGETLYSINAIPFGGFVKIFGEDGEHRSEPHSFGSKSFIQRMKVILAGVVVNVLFAALLLIIGNGVGLRIGLVDQAQISEARDKQIQIIQVAKDSPAEQAGVNVLDSVVGFKSGGSTVTPQNVEDVQEFVSQHGGQTVTMVLSHGGEIVEKKVTIRANPPAGQGPLGISLAHTGIVSYPWYEALGRGVKDAVMLTINTVQGYAMLIKNLIVTRHLGADVSGPIGIASLTGQAARIGFTYLLQFVAMISINLAVLNSIPFPALDGGRAFMLIVEKIKGSPINKKAELIINTAGFLVLMALMLYITAKDILKFL